MSTNSIANLMLPTGFTYERTFQGIDELVLSNGLRVLLFEDPSQANVTVNITYLVGSRHEGRGEAGMAHLLEHMLFRGTHKTRDVKKVLQDRGAQFNATTWYDRTNYFETLTPTEENLRFALELEADRMLNSLILQEDLDAEMTVVRNEFEMGENNPVHVLHDQLMSSAYRWHNYGKTTIGNRSDIERVPAKTLRAFYEHYYQPDNAVLIVAGQFSKQMAIDLIAEYYLCLKKPTRILDQTYTEEPAQDGPREVILERVGDMASVALGYHIPASSHKDHAAIKVLVDAMNDEPSGVIYQHLVENGTCSENFSMVYALYEPGMALFFVRPTDESDPRVVRDELITLVEKGFTAVTEVHIERIKNRALKRIKQSMSNSKELALKLSEAIACGDWRLFFWYRDQIKSVTLNDVMRVAKRYFISSNRTSGVFIPQKEPMRVAVERAPALSLILSHIEEDPSLSSGEIFVAKAENIEKLVKRAEVGPGKKVAVLSKKTRGQSVRLQTKVRFASADALLPYTKEFWLLPALLWRGTTRYDYQGLRDKIDSLMSTVDIDGNAGVMSLTAKTERAYVSELFATLMHILSEPKFDVDEFAIVQKREIDNYEEIKSDPQRLGFLELERLKNPWPKDHILYVHSFDEIIAALKKLDVNRVREAHQKLFALDRLLISAVGDCDSDSLVHELPKILTNSQARVPYERIVRPFIENVATELTLDTKDKEMAIIAYGFNFPMRDDHEDYAALKLANYMFGENMNSRLMMRIREKEGISYGAGSGVDISRYDESANLTIYAMAAPQSVARAQRAIDEEWSRFLNDGVTPHELESAQESIWLSFENMLANDNFLAGALAHDLDIGRTFLMREKLYLRMKALSVNDIKAVAQKWWGNRQFSKVIAADVAKLG